MESWNEKTVSRDALQEGRALLARPVLPLVSMVQFLFLTGPFATVAEVVEELPEPIETGTAAYPDPRRLLAGYLDVLAGLEQAKEGGSPEVRVVDETDRPVDALTGFSALIRQRILEEELERINSLLCAPCGCTLCCVGPAEEMEQEYFEIPLAGTEPDLFDVPRCDSAATRAALPDDDPEPIWEGRAFYRVEEPALFHWRKGWSLILPEKTTCPQLDAGGRCRVYDRRPRVCRRPQIFPYVVEPLDVTESGPPVVRIRESLLAVVDCPYVRALREEIEGYAAACELALHLKRNKN
ncbi:MAG: hypothetical protein Kow0089_06570 [Desulfobulbaceae bacterium]